MFSNPRHRHRQPEWLDEPDADPVLLRKSFTYIRWINSLLRYTRATISHLERFSERWTPGEQVEILDIATGSADIPRAILRWADRRRFNVRVTGIDRHPGALHEASHPTDNRLHLVRGDALELPFDDNSFDYVITNMFLHHLDDAQIVTVLQNMARVSRKGIIAADLIRNRRAYFWISVFTLLANPMVRHDARVSVAQAFTEEEVLALRDRAGLDFASYYGHFAHRFVLAGEKAGR